LSESSTYPHHFYESDDQSLDDNNGLVVATLHTQPSSEYYNLCLNNDRTVELSDGDLNEDTSDETNDLEQMSKCLDALGWKKVFIDVRKEIPRITLPKYLIKRTMASMGRLSPTEETDVNTDGNDDARVDRQDTEAIDALKERRVVGSKEIHGTQRSCQECRTFGFLSVH
jgi:hypothetical protein